MQGAWYLNCILRYCLFMSVVSLLFTLRHVSNLISPKASIQTWSVLRFRFPATWVAIVFLFFAMHAEALPHKRQIVDCFEVVAQLKSKKQDFVRFVFVESFGCSVWWVKCLSKAYHHCSNIFLN